MTTTIQDINERPFTIAATDADGNEAPLNGGSVSSSDETIVTAFLNSDGKSGVVKAVGPLGTATVTYTGDGSAAADGSDPLTVVLDEIEVIASNATTVVPSFGAEEAAGTTPQS